MGTRADFYVGRGPEAEWLGSIAWDGYPDGVFVANKSPEYLPPDVASEDAWRAEVADFLAQREDATLPEQGWPWPWDDSGTTDYAYALDDGVVYASGFGYGWFPVAEGEPEDEDGDRDRSGGKTAVFPDMSARKNFTMGTRSGVMLIGAQGPIDGAQIDAEEATRANVQNVQDCISLAIQRSRGEEGASMQALKDARFIREGLASAGWKITRWDTGEEAPPLGPPPDEWSATPGAELREHM